MRAFARLCFFAVARNLHLCGRRCQFDAAECREHPGAHPSAECEERCPTDRRFLEVIAVCCQLLHEKVYQHVIDCDCLDKHCNGLGMAIRMTKFLLVCNQGVFWVVCIMLSLEKCKSSLGGHQQPKRLFLPDNGLFSCCPRPFLCLSAG